jgi:crotonobetainyl-CoA:carnitine CoA-transferase CaiB-like acyl-CoA transferase
MDYATLAALKPTLIYCQGSGFGAHGPFSNSAGNEMMGLARSGFMLGSAHADGEPVYPTVGANDRLRDANDPMCNFYRCRDGVWVALGMVIHKDKFWPQVCEALGDPELATDARFATVELASRIAGNW